MSAGRPAPSLSMSRPPLPGTNPLRRYASFRVALPSTCAERHLGNRRGRTPEHPAAQSLKLALLIPCGVPSMPVSLNNLDKVAVTHGPPGDTREDQVAPAPELPGRLKDSQRRARSRGMRCAMPCVFMRAGRYRPCSGVFVDLVPPLRREPHRSGQRSASRTRL